MTKWWYLKLAVELPAGHATLCTRDVWKSLSRRSAGYLARMMNTYDHKRAHLSLIIVEIDIGLQIAFDDRNHRDR